MAVSVHEARATRPVPGRPHTKPLQLPLVFTLALAGMAFLPAFRDEAGLFWSCLAAAAALTVWNAALALSAHRAGRSLRVDVSLRKQHYLQACAQGSVLVYWGLYWEPVSANLIAAQLAFAYAFDMLLDWSRRDDYTLGFAPFPVIFSINLFLWFKPDWFYLQFLMIATGFAAKQLITWEKEGRRAHIFNPSSFPLAVFSLALILTNNTSLTWGVEIATTQFYPPNIYLFIFLIGLPGQFFFGVTTMTMSAVVTTYLFSLAYYLITGVYFFYDSYVPIAVFLGMHLLFTDPSTSPRTELGRIIFGVIYGLSTVGLYALAGVLGFPKFYDKLLQVPLMNLSIKAIDRAVRSRPLSGFDPSAIGRSLAARQRHLAYISIWVLVFAGLSATQSLGDYHQGQWLPFWQKACTEGRPGACEYAMAVQADLCDQGSGWACNQLGVNQAELADDRGAAGASFARGCELGFAAACANVRQASTAPRFETAPPGRADYPYVLKGTKGPLPPLSEQEMQARACRQGWTHACAAETAAAAQ